MDERGPAREAAATGQATQSPSGASDPQVRAKKSAELKASLVEVELMKADLRGANLVGANLSNSDLTNSNLLDAKLGASVNLGEILL